MTKREELTALIEQKEEQIVQIRSEINEIYRQTILLSDDKQWFTEEVEHHPKAKYQRKEHWLDGKLVGRIHWKQNVKDSDTGDIYILDRSALVRVDGKWLDC